MTVWSDYVVLAEVLADLDAEASQRSAVSRAYYGAFNSARRWLEANFGPIDRLAVHGQVWRAFQAPELSDPASRMKWQAIGELGDYLRGLRNRADYDDSMPDLDRHAAVAVAGARRILALLPELELAG